MSNLGSRTRSYLGTRAASPVNCTFNTIAPTPYDNSDALYSVGDEWVYTNPLSPDPANPVVQIYKLVSLAGNQTSTGSLAHWVLLEASTDPAFFYQGNTGPQATPTTAGVLNIVGDGVGIKTVSDANHTVTISLEQGDVVGASSFVTNVGGTAYPDADGHINVYGSNNIFTNTGGVGPDQIIVNLVNSPSVSGTLTAGQGITSTTGDIQALAGNIGAALAMTAGTGLTVTTGPVQLGGLGFGVVLSSAAGLLSVSNPGTATTVLTSNGPGVAPTWQAGGGGGGGGTTSFITTFHSPVVPTGGGAISFLGTANSANTGAGTTANFASTDGTTANVVNILPGIGANVSSNGKVYIGGSSGGGWATLTAGAGITVGNADGSITITNTGGGGGTGLVTAHTDSGDATVTANALTFSGTGGFIHTSGATSVVSIGQVTNPTITGNVTLSGLGQGVVQSSSGGALTSTIGTPNQVMMTNKAGTAQVWGDITAGTNVTLVTSSSGIQINATGGAGSGVTQVNAGQNIVVSGPTTTPTVALANTIHWGASDLTHCAIFTNTYTNTSPGTIPWLHAFGQDNAFFGNNAGNQTTLVSGTANDNIGIGSNALTSLTTGSSNTCVGFNAGTALTTGTLNTIIGVAAGKSLTTGGNATYIGYQAGTLSTVGNNTVVGHQAFNSATTASQNIAIGDVALNNTVTGASNVAVGWHALTNLGNTSDNTALGTFAMSAATTASQCSVFGSGAGNGVLTATGESYYGYQSGAANTSGSGNAFYGFQSGKANTTGANNSFIGYQSGLANITGARNLFAGTSSGSANTTNDNVYLGHHVGILSTTSTQNVIAGSLAAAAMTTLSSSNVVLGYQAANAMTSGCTTNVIIGQGAAALMTSNSLNNIVIGAGSGSAWR